MAALYSRSMQLTGFDLSTSSDSSVSSSSAFRVSVLFCLTQEKTRSQCALLCGMVRMPSITLARAWNGFTPPPFFLSLSAFPTDPSCREHSRRLSNIAIRRMPPTASRALNQLASAPGKCSQRTPDLQI